MRLVRYWRELTVISMLLLSGCATVPQDQVVAEDPWQGYNRAMFKFNAGLDKAVIKPAAKGYRWVMPGFAEKGVSNFFSNLGDVPIMINNLLQGSFKAAGSDSLRLLMNTIYGVGGLFDHASGVGLIKHEEDFGQTLAKWGVPSGPYLVMPVLGPGGLRDSSAWFVDQGFNPMSYLDDEIYWPLRVVNILDVRVSVLKLEQSTGIGVYDDYTQMREIYLQRRKHLISNGNDEANRDEEEELRRELEMLEE